MEYLPEFTLHRPQTAQQAVTLKAADETSRYVAGGTDMIVNIRRGIETPGTLIDLTNIDDFAQISRGPDGIKIGAGVRLAELADHSEMGKDYHAVIKAATSVAGPTHRQYGTVGGNLCLDTRCLYYNQSQWWRESNDFCLKHKGEVCHVAPGGKFCFAAFSGDLAPALLVHDAEVEIVGKDGTRVTPLEDLYSDDGLDHLTLSHDELLVSVRLPKPAEGSVSSYEKSRIRGSIDFPLAGCAVSLSIEEQIIKDIKIALTAVNPAPQLLKVAEELTGLPVDEQFLDKVRDVVRAHARPMTTTTVRPWYRRRVVGALARKLVKKLAAA